MAAYFSGKKLYGDDFSLEELRDWYNQEKEGYSDILKGSKPNYDYDYHELNKIHGFRYVKLQRNCRALGIGSAYCDEFIPILPRLSHITSLDPSNRFARDKLENVPVSCIQPSIDGKAPFLDNSFDIITCLGALHHIANVSYVLRECYRCLKPGGVMFLREPIVSMGDWRRLRRGLTKNERGIPYNLLVEMIRKQNFAIGKITLFDFAPFGSLLGRFGFSTFSYKSTTLLDQLLCRIFAFNKKYHRVGILEKFGPAQVYMLLYKKHRYREKEKDRV
jgi:SAM-dependent methyltransferase